MSKKQNKRKERELQQELEKACLMFGARLTYFNVFEGDNNIEEMKADLFFMINKVRKVGASEGAVTCPCCDTIVFRFELMA